jgi:hypothetical protein
MVHYMRLSGYIHKAKVVAEVCKKIPAVEKIELKKFL